jgi:uncharacterized lipoprotein
MSYRVPLLTIEEPFNNAWFHVCEILPQYNSISDIEDYFQKHYGMKLISKPSMSSVWVWSDIVFKSKSAYVMFMLEWS